MDGWVFANPHWVHLVWPALAVAAAAAFLELRGTDALARFVSPAMQPRIARRVTTPRRGARLALFLTTVLLGIVALMRPQTPGGAETLDRRVQADILVALDVSRSMLAEDAAPNRLARAKAEVAEFIERVEGQRVGLIAFAGRASVLSPLTSDYGYFRLVLRDAGPGSAGRGGTRIGDAIGKAIAAFGAHRDTPRILVLITDGEDHDSFPQDAADKAVAAGIRIVAIGFGAETGSEIAMTDPATGARTLVRDADGAIVRSRLDGAMLRDLALRTDGIYVPAGTSAVDIDAIVRAYVEPIVAAAATRMVRRRPTEHYRWFVLGALLTLLAGSFLGATGAAPPPTRSAA